MTCCEGQPLDKIFRFRYLGTIFAANASQYFDIDSRIVMVMVRCGRLRSIFDSEFITLNLKLRLYEAAVCSLPGFIDVWVRNLGHRRKNSEENQRLQQRHDCSHHREIDPTRNETIHNKPWFDPKNQDAPSQVARSHSKAGSNQYCVSGDEDSS